MHVFDKNIKDVLNPYITTKKKLLESQLRYSGKIGCVEMPLSRSFQIDTLEDLELIKKLL